ncbi:MAG: AbrB/MazE/SpoVT family DNA-binding domain-containing protein [Nitrospira sp.]|nr:AbrB/MazE/SpoVT family DNA-binding domain-containing protein [Nitrospira sp.]
MRVTTKGQVTIPRKVREELGINPHSEVEFVKQKDGSYRLIKRNGSASRSSRVAALRGTATVKMTTEEIMALTRGR